MTEMDVDTAVIRGSYEVLMCSRGYVRMVWPNAVWFTETEIDDVDLTGKGPKAHDEVGGFDVPMNESSGMNGLEKGDLEIDARRC